MTDLLVSTWKEDNLSKSLPRYFTENVPHVLLPFLYMFGIFFLQNTFRETLVKNLFQVFIELFDDTLDLIILLSYLSVNTLYFSNILIKKAKRLKSEDREDATTSRLIHLWPNTVLKCSPTLHIKWAEASSCMYHINNLSAKGIGSNNWDNVFTKKLRKISDNRFERITGPMRWHNVLTQC